MSYRIKNKQLNILWPISILKFCLPFFSVCFFGQSFLLLTTIFDCQSGFAYVSKNLICRTGIWFQVDGPLALSAMILHAILALITNTLYYKSNFVKFGSDVLKKTNSYPDIILLFTKIFVIVLFILDDGKEEEHWAVLFFLILVTGLNTFCNFFYQNRQNKKLNYLNNIFSLMPFLGFCSLFIGKIFSFLGFNGSIFLFFSWVVFGVLFILFYKKKDMDFALINYKEIDNPGDYLNYVHNFHKIIMNKNSSRNDYTILKSLIAKKEEKCFDKQCPLKKYIENSSNDIDDIFPLLQFCEKLFDFGISKFPNDISLKINYSMFLIFEMNNNKKALITLNCINASVFALQDNYNIYRCQRLIDEFIINKNKSKNIINSFEYKNKMHDFKLLISKSTSLYYDFWTLIIINKLNFTNNLDDLNKIGSEIIQLNKKIEEEYELLIKMKPDDYDLISFYSNFNENILNNQEKIKRGKTKTSSSSYNNISDSQEIQFTNFDINTLKEKDLFKYIILSGNKKSLANIIEISTNLCHIFGYYKEEIIGKNVNYLIPELFHKAHNILLDDFNQKAQSNFYKELFTKDNYIPDYLEKNVYAISKSKFLIPLKLKVYFVQNEGNEFVYIVEVTKIKDFQDILERNEENDLKCVVLTDENYYIQTFTPNCVSYLKLNDSYINANYNIINYIKQIKNEYLKKINEVIKTFSLNTNKTIKNYPFQESSDSQKNKFINDNISYLEKKKIKKDLIEKYTAEQHKITWKIFLNNHNNNLKFPIEDSIFRHSLINNKDDIYSSNHKNIFEENFILEIQKININKKLIGFYFIFYYEPKEINNLSNFISINITNLNERRNSISKQKKYKYLFQTKQTLFKKITNDIKGKESEINLIRSKSPRKMVKFKSYEKEQFMEFKKIIEENNKTSDKNKSSKSINTNFKSDINNEENNEQVYINEEYIPESPFNFVFDFNNRAYKAIYNIKNKNENNLNEILQFQALQKIKNFKEYLEKKNEKKNTNSRESDTNESEESDSEEKESSSMSNNLNSSKKSNKDETIQKYSSLKLQTNNKNNDNNPNKENNSDNNKNKTIENKKDILNELYRVNLSKIHFSIYDFNKDMTIDINFEKKSQIDDIIQKFKSKSSKKIQYSDIYSNILYNNIIEEKRKNYSISNINNSNDSKKEKLSDEKIIENKILEAINKQQNEENIVTIHKYSFVLIFILIVFSGIYLYFEISLYLDSKEILLLIKNIITINYSNKIGLYFIRELTLLNVPDTEIKGGQYIIIPASNKQEYIALIRQNILNYFIESQVAMNDFIESNFKVSKKSEDYLTQTKLVTKFSKDDLKSTNVKNNIIITIVQLNSAFYNLASSTSPVQQNHADLFTFVYNSLNNFGIAIDILIEIYRKELVLKTNSYELIFKIQLLLYLIIDTTIYIFVLILYSKIVKRKKSYIKVFFNINFDFISLSINKCERFINKFKLAEEKKAKDDEINDSYEEDSNLIQENYFKEPTLNLKRKSLKMNTTKRKKNFKCSKNIIFQIFFGILLLISYLIYYILGFFYILNLNNTSKDISNFYFHLQQYHLSIIEYYNIYREYLFDDNSKILNMTPYENLVLKEKMIYGNWTNDVNNITFYTKTLINDKDIRESLNKSLCSYNITDYFKSEDDCIKEVGNSYNQDINTFCYGFIDEIRIKKNIIKILLEMGIFIGDLTEYKTEYWHDMYYDLFNQETNEDPTTKKKFRLELFNDGYFHTISNIFFINIILPCLNENRNIIFNYLTIVGKNNIFYFLLTIFILLLVAIYIFYWSPNIKRLNRIIFETKNMLKIIPMHILMADMNIKTLLHISMKK